jgi:hypothetical protein
MNRDWVDLDEQGVLECDATPDEECDRYGKGLDVCLGCPVDARNRERAEAPAAKESA